MKKPCLIIMLAFSGLIFCTANNTFAQSSVSSKETAVLSENLVDFKGKSQKNAILLSWKTISASSDLIFKIQRSKDGAEWEDIGDVNGSEIDQNTYSFTDDKPMESLCYYRLKIEKNGRSDFSSLISVKYVTETDRTLIYPNPTNNVIYIKAEEANNDAPKQSLEVYDLLGDRVYASAIESGNLQKLDMSNYQNGYYYIRVGGQVYKVLKN